MLTLELFITGKCNMNCAYCHLNGQLPKIDMPLDVAENAIDFCVSQRREGQIIDIHFTGGEPFINLDTIQSVLQHTSSIPDLKFRITTNGTLLNQTNCSFLEQKNVFVSVSIDGMEDTHTAFRKTSCSSYNQIINNLHILIDSKCNYEVGMSVHPQVVHLLKNNFDELVKEGVKHFYIAPVYGKTAIWDDNCIEELITCYKYIASVALRYNLSIGPFNFDSEHVGDRLKGQWGCNAGCMNLAVLPDGTYAPCSSLAPFVKEQPILNQGSVYNGLSQNNCSFNDLIHNDCNYSMCKDCSMTNNCLGGCLAINLSSTGNLFCPPTWYCKLIKNFQEIWKIRWQ